MNNPGKPVATVKSAARVLDLLEILGAAGRPAGVTELARRLRIPKSSTFALLETLAARGYARRTPEGFAAGERLIRSASLGVALSALIPSARPLLNDIVERTGESALLARLTPEMEVNYLDQATSAAHPVRYDTDISVHRPAYCTSAGLAMLAFQPVETVERYVRETTFTRMTPRTITTAARLRATLARVRRLGYAESVDGRLIGVAGVSAPVLDERGIAIASICIPAPTERYLRKRAGLIAAARAAARRLSATRQSAA